MISRSDAIKIIMDKISPNHLVVSTTGMISRELFNIHDRKENFYMIGSMGLAASFAMGISISNQEKICQGGPSLIDRAHNIFIFVKTSFTIVCS